MLPRCDKGVCSCKQGYYLAEDQKSCITTHSPSLLALFHQSSGKATLVQHPTVQLWGLEDSAEHRAREMLRHLLSLENVQALDYHISLQVLTAYTLAMFLPYRCLSFLLAVSFYPSIREDDF